MSDPQDMAEAYDEEATGTDPDDPDRSALVPDEPYLVDEELVTEPIADSVESREARLVPDDDQILAAARNEHDVDLMEEDLSEELVSDELRLVSDEHDLSAEEEAIHVVDTTY